MLPAIDPKLIREKIDNLVTVVASRVKLLEEQNVGADSDQRWRLALAWVLEMEATASLRQIQLMQEFAETIRKRFEKGAGSN